MGKDDKGHRVTMIVAIIGLVGLFGVAMIRVVPTLIERWSRTPASPSGETKPEPEPPELEPLPAKVDKINSQREPEPVPLGELKKEIVGKDGVPMVLIPAREEYGLHHDAFYMDKYEVSNAAYKKFVDATGHRSPEYWGDPKLNKPGHPVVDVYFYDAVVYCKWVGERLPTGGEWEYAARGGLVGKEYPWGDEEPTHDKANYWGTGGRDKWEHIAPVGSFPPNGYGLYDMAGNVMEWCREWFDDSDETALILRGGSWSSYFPDRLRVAYRHHFYSLSSHYYDVGFRCIQDADVTP